MRLNPDTGQPESSPEQSQRGYGLHWRRRIRGSGLAKEDAPPLHRDEQLHRKACIAGLRKIFYTLPKGGKKPLARELKLTLVQLRSIVRGRGVLPEACRRRVSRFLMQYARSEIELQRISPEANPRALWQARKPSHAWIHKPSLSNRIPDQQWLKAVESDAESVVFHPISERLIA